MLIETSTLMDIPEDKQPSSLEERVAELEKQVAELQAYKHNSHAITPDVMEQIAMHTIARINDAARILMHKPAEAN